MGEELRIVLKKQEDIAAFHRVKGEMRDAGANNVEVVRRLITCFYELQEMKEKEGKEQEKPEEMVEPEVVELRQRLRRAQQIILDKRRQLEKQEEYIRAAEERLIHYVLGRSPRRVWRLSRILEKAYQRRKPFESCRVRRDIGMRQSLFAKDLRELTELGLLRRLHWGIYVINYFHPEEFIREIGRRMVRREIKRRIEKGEEWQESNPL